MNSLFKKIATGTAVLALTTTIFAPSAFAADTSTTITGADSLEITSISATALDNVTLDGSLQTVTASLNGFEVTDARGSGAGWNVTTAATPFKNTNTENPSTLSEGSLNLTAPNVSPKEGSSTDNITIAGGEIDAESAAPVKTLSAAEDGGMGSFTVDSSEMTLTLQPKEVYAGTYSSTVTVSLTTGP